MASQTASPVAMRNWGQRLGGNVIASDLSRTENVSAFARLPAIRAPAAAGRLPSSQYEQPSGNGWVLGKLQCPIVGGLHFMLIVDLLNEKVSPTMRSKSRRENSE